MNSERGPRKWIKEHHLEIEFSAAFIGAVMLSVIGAYGIAHAPEFLRQLQQSPEEQYPDHLLRAPVYSPTQLPSVKTR